MNSSVNGLDSLKGTLDLSTFLNGIHLCVIKNFVVIKNIFFITEQLKVNQLVSCMFIKLSIFTL